MSINPNDFAYMTPAMLDTLRTLGITQVEQIAAYTAPELDKLPIRGVGLKVAQRWIDKARQLIAAKLANSTVQSLQMAAQVAPVVQSTDLLGVKMPTQLLTCNNLCTELASKLKLAVVCNTVQLSCNNTVITSVALPAPKIPVKITTVAGTVLPGPYYMDAAGVVTDANCNVVTPAATDVVTCVCSDGGTTPTPTGPVLKVTKTVSPNPAVVGVPATYSVTVQNIGSSSAVNVVVNDVVPSVTTYLAGSIAGGDSRSDATPATGNGLQWNLGGLAAGASQTFTYKAIPKSATPYINKATAKASNATIASGAISDTPINSTQYIQMSPVSLVATSQAGTLCNGSIATNLQLIAPTRLGPIPSAQAAFRDTAIFSPAATQNEQLHLVDTSQIAGVGTRSKACITFSQPVTNPVLHVGDIDRTNMDFAPYAAANGLTGLTKLSGSANLQANGLVISSLNPIPSGGVSFSNPVVPGTSGYGSIQLNGTFTQVCWDYVVVSDSVENHYLQVSTVCP